MLVDYALSDKEDGCSDNKGDSEISDKSSENQSVILIDFLLMVKQGRIYNFATKKICYNKKQKNH